MVHISKEKLPEQLEKKLLDQLGSIFMAQQRVPAVRNILYELFTPSERVLFIKRVAIIALLRRKYTPYSIGIALQVSESTVARIASKYHRGGFIHIVKTLERKEYRESILGTLEALLSLGVPGEANRRVRAQMRKDIEAWRSGAK